MIRVKTFDSTGIAPGGRIFAGDLNAIQDAAAALTDLTQALSVGTLTVGESGLTLGRYGAGEARLTGKFRTSGLLTAEGGVLPGTFTTAARNAIPSGSRPKGISVFNSDLNMWEFNSGTDGSPSWTTIGAAASTSGALSAIPAANAVLAGSFFYATDMDVLYRSNGSAWSRVNSVAGDIFMTLNASAAPGRILLQGQAWPSTSGIYADLYAKWGGATLPDMRGRIPVNIGTNGDINALRMDDGLAVGQRSPKHNSTKSGTVTKNGTVTRSGNVTRAGAVTRTGGVAISVQPDFGVSAQPTFGVTQQPNFGVTAQPSFADSGHAHTIPNEVRTSIGGGGAETVDPGGYYPITAGKGYLSVAGAVANIYRNGDVGIGRTADVGIGRTGDVALARSVNAAIADTLGISDGISINDAIAINDGISLSDGISVGPGGSRPSDTGAFLVVNFEAKL
jgi:hypothetical protein